MTKLGLKRKIVTLRYRLKLYIGRGCINSKTFFNRRSNGGIPFNLESIILMIQINTNLMIDISIHYMLLLLLLVLLPSFLKYKLLLVIIISIIISIIHCIRRIGFLYFIDIVRHLNNRIVIITNIRLIRVYCISKNNIGDTENPPDISFLI